MSITKFLAYHNAVPITLGILFLGTGAAMAANEDVREAVIDGVYQAEEVVVSVDNSYILHKNLAGYSPEVRITGVTEDDDNYYVTYDFVTINIQDKVWQDVTNYETLIIKKETLGGRDLGLHVSRQLREIIAADLRRLQETQTIEKEIGESRRVVATAYSGLVGRFMDATEETLPGYTPVIPEPESEPKPKPKPKPEPEPVVVATTTDSAATTTDNGNSDIATSTDDGTGDMATSTDSGSDVDNGDDNSGNGGGGQGEGDTTPPTIQILGDNPTELEVGGTYTELGVAVTDDSNQETNIEISGSVDTGTAGTYIVTYVATDVSGNATTIERTVIVVGSDAGGSEEETDSATTTDDGSGEPSDDEEVPGEPSSEGSAVNNGEADDTDNLVDEEADDSEPDSVSVTESGDGSESLGSESSTSSE